MNGQVTRNSRHLLELLGLGFILVVGYAYFNAARFEDFLGCSLVLFAALMPVAFWILSGSTGIPILPTAAILYWVYYGLPTMRGVGERGGYSPQHVLDADVTVTLFLVVATASWVRFLYSSRQAGPKKSSRAMNRRAVISLVMIGLGLGVAFFALTYSEFYEVLGNTVGIVRAVLLGPLLLACYFLGYGQAKGMFTSLQMVFALAALGVVLVLQIGGLQLIAGATEIGAALLGYIFTARKVPWITIILFGAVVSVLQAGKSDIRDRWSIIDIKAGMTPALITDWVETGLNAIQNNSGHQSVADRASLLNQMIRVQVWTPERVPYLQGETYAYLPSMVVPRIINPSRAPTQVVMGLLDVRYGFLTRQQIKFTAVGVNIVPEAYANLGYIGVVVIGVIFGLFTGYFTRLSANREGTSLGTLLAIAAMAVVMDMEADLSYMFTTFFQSCVAITAFYYGLRYVFDTRQPATGLRNTA